MRIGTMFHRWPGTRVRYGACNSSYDITRCPFSARLRAQIATYASNYARVCPQGCHWDGLIVRSQCQSWTSESVTAKGILDGSLHQEAIVNLLGGGCDDTTFYIPVVMENNQLVADDVFCNDDLEAFGMYNSSLNASGGSSCSAN